LPTIVDGVGLFAGEGNGVDRDCAGEMRRDEREDGGLRMAGMEKDTLKRGHRTERKKKMSWRLESRRNRQAGMSALLGMGGRRSSPE